MDLSPDERLASDLCGHATVITAIYETRDLLGNQAVVGISVCIRLENDDFLMKNDVSPLKLY